MYIAKKTCLSTEKQSKLGETFSNKCNLSLAIGTSGFHFINLLSTEKPFKYKPNRISFTLVGSPKRIPTAGENLLSCHVLLLLISQIRGCTCLAFFYVNLARILKKGPEFHPTKGTSLGNC